MRVVRGRVTAGRIELEESLPEGTEVTVVVRSEEESFDLEEHEVRALEESLAEAMRGETVPAKDVLSRLGRR